MTENDFLKNVLQTAKAENWTRLRLGFEQPNKSFGDFSKPNTFDKSNKTILHYACGAADAERAKAGVELILQEMTSFPHEHDELQKFLNHKNSDDETAMDIAIRLGRQEIMDLLVEKGVAIPIRFDPKMTGTLLSNLLNDFDHGIDILKDQQDETNEYQWTVYANFGSLRRSNLGESKLLANVLDLPRPRRRLVLMHPLVQLFVHSLWQNYKWLIGMSIILNFLWCMMSAHFIIGTMALNLNQTISNQTGSNQTVSGSNQTVSGSNQTVSGSNQTVSGSNQTVSGSNISNPTISNQSLADQNMSNKTISNQTITNGTNLSSNFADVAPSEIMFYVFFSIFYVIVFFTKVIEMFNIPSKCYSLRQIQNWGQVTLLVVVPIAAVTRIVLHVEKVQFEKISTWLQIILCLLYTVGLLASLFLVQGLFIRSECCGVYNQMMVKSFKRLIKVLISFGALLITFAVIFSMLLPEEVIFSLTWQTMFVGFTKILAMTSGELNINDVITKENIGKIAFVVPAVVVYFSFILVVLVLLLNVLIGLAVVDTEKSRRRAQAAHVASCLEAVFLMETFIKGSCTQWILSCFGLKNWLNNKLYLASRASTDEEAQLMPENRRFPFRFVKIRKQIRKEIVKIHRLFPNGYDDNGDSDLSDLE